MANLIRKREREQLARGTEQGLRFGPFHMMRDLLGWDPFGEMFALSNVSERAFNPDVEVKETKDGYVFKADLPGLRDKDVEITINGNQITISGKREEEASQEGDRFYAYERSYGSFSRTFTLPSGANPEDVTADLKDGVLHLEVRKRPEVQGRKIPLHGGESAEVTEKKELTEPSEKKETKAA